MPSSLVLSTKNEHTKRKGLIPFLSPFVCLSMFFKSEAKCITGCPLALASYYVWEGSNLTYMATIFNQTIPVILKYNSKVPNQNSIRTGTRISVPFSSCECLNGDFLGHTFVYITQAGDTYEKIARVAFSGLTNEYWLQRVNVYNATQIPDFAPINVTVNCSCGDAAVSQHYGLFVTYPLRPGENLSSVAKESGVPLELLQGFNPGSNFRAGSGLVFVPARGWLLGL